MKEGVHSPNCYKYKEAKELKHYCLAERKRAWTVCVIVSLNVIFRVQKKNSFVCVLGLGNKSDA